MCPGSFQSVSPSPRTQTRHNAPSDSRGITGNSLWAPIPAAAGGRSHGEAAAPLPLYARGPGGSRREYRALNPGTKPGGEPRALNPGRYFRPQPTTKHPARRGHGRPEWDRPALISGQETGPSGGGKVVFSWGLKIKEKPNLPSEITRKELPN